MLKVFIILLIILIAGCTQNQDINPSIFPEVLTVARVYDGDTFAISNGEMIRVLGIDYPDIDDYKMYKWTDMGLDETKVINCYYEGITKMENLFLNEKVILTKDPNEDDKDKYNRLLRYASVNNKDIGEWLVSNGYAVMYDPTYPLCEKCKSYQDLTNQIREKNQGCLWSS